MALKIYDKFAPRANPGDTNYPNGSIKNESAPGAKDGTPLDADWGNDYAGFDAALFAEAGVTPSGDPDTALSSQRLSAIIALGAGVSGAVFNTVADLTNNGAPDGTAETALGTRVTFKDGMILKVAGLGGFIDFYQVTTSPTAPGAVTLGGGLYAGGVVVPQRSVICATLNTLISGSDQLGYTMDFAFLSSKKVVVKTNVNNTFMLNESPGGGASYQILTVADYGGIPDGETIGGVVTGADHYIGGGTDYVAKYMPVKNEIDAEALGYYSGQNSGTDFSDATATFNKVINYANGRPIKLGEKQNYYYAGEFGDQLNEKDRITIIGTSMPSMSYNPNNPKEYTRLEGGTRIRGFMSLWCKSGRFRDFGVDGAPEATGSWHHNYDAFKVITESTSKARDVQLNNVIGLGKSYDTPSHAIIVSGHRRSTVSNCQGYSTWYGLSIDALQSVVSGFIGGNNGRNVVNAKSHQATGTSGSKFNNNMTLSNINGFNPKGPSGEYIGAAIVAIEADANALERVTVNNVTGEGCRALIALAPFNGAVMKSVTISNVIGADFSDTTIAGGGSDYSAIYSRAGSGGGEIYTLNISNVQLSEVKYRAAKFENVRFLNADNFQANTGIGGVGIAPTINTDLVSITSTVLSASLDGFLLTNSFGLTGGTGQGTILWANTAANNRKGPRMISVNKGAGAPP